MASVLQAASGRITVTITRGSPGSRGAGTGSPQTGTILSTILSTNLRRRYPARAYEYELLGPGHVEAEGIRVDHGPALVVVIVFAPAADPDVGVRQRRRAVDVERRGRGRMVHDALRRGKITVPDDYVALLEAHEALVVAVVDVVDERR